MINTLVIKTHRGHRSIDCYGPRFAAIATSAQYNIYIIYTITQHTKDIKIRQKIPVGYSYNSYLSIAPEIPCLCAQGRKSSV